MCAVTSPKPSDKKLKIILITHTQTYTHTLKQLSNSYDLEKNFQHKHGLQIPYSDWTFATIYPFNFEKKM